MSILFVIDLKLIPQQTFNLKLLIENFISKINFIFKSVKKMKNENVLNTIDFHLSFIYIYIYMYIYILLKDFHLK